MREIKQNTLEFSDFCLNTVFLIDSAAFSSAWLNRNPSNVIDSVEFTFFTKLLIASDVRRIVSISFMPRKLGEMGEIYDKHQG